LRALVVTLMAKLEATVNERDALAEQNDRIRQLLLKLKRMQFGAKSERLPEAQLQLGLEALEQAIARGEAEAEKRDPDLRKDGVAKRRASRGALPAHLPRIEVTLAPEDTACPCCKVAMTVIGEDSSERLDVVPAQFRVIVTRRPKLIGRGCAGAVVQMPVPPRLIEGGIPTEAMVAHVLVARYADHLPLYRQAQDTRTAGRDPRSLDLVILDGLRGSRTRPRCRPVARDDAELDTAVCRRDRRPGTRPWPWADQARLFLGDRARRSAMGGSQLPTVVYRYAPGRGHLHANALLGGYRGILQCDAYAAYKKLVGPKQHEHAVTLVFCWSHVHDNRLGN
jgi:transposase